MKRISAEGGIAQTLCETHETSNFGGAWSPNGTIIFSPDGESGLYRVSATGGAAKPLTIVDTAHREYGHFWPHFLPDGQHFLFAVDSALSDRDGIYVGSLDSPQRQLLLHALSSVAYVPPGYLLFSRDRTLMAQRFDENRLRLIGQPAVVAEGLAFELWGGTRSLFSASLTGVLAYRTDNVPDASQLTWFSRDGTRLGTLGPVGLWGGPALSPDEKTVAATNGDNKVGDDIWLFDRSRGSGIRFTTEPGWDVGPIWSPDGQHIIFSSDRLGPFNLFRKAVNGGSSEELVFESPMWSFPMDWSSSGRVLIYQAKDPTTRLDLWALCSETARTRLVQSPFNDSDGSLSPDMRWLCPLRRVGTV